MKKLYTNILLMCCLLPIGCGPAMMVTSMGNDQYHVSCDDSQTCRSEAPKKARSLCMKPHDSQLHALPSDDGKYHIIVDCDWDPEL